MKEIPAYQLIQKSHTLNINHSDADTFEYHFTKQNLIDSRIEDNIIFLQDVDDIDCQISCFELVPTTL